MYVYDMDGVTSMNINMNELVEMNTPKTKPGSITAGQIPLILYSYDLMGSYRGRSRSFSATPRGILNLSKHSTATRC